LISFESTYSTGMGKPPKMSIRLARTLAPVFALLMGMSGCGGSDSNRDIGNSIQNAFLKTLVDAANRDGPPSYVAQSTIYSCHEQNSGVPLGQLTVGELQGAQGSMLFHCAVTETATGGPAVGGSEGWLYYLELRTGGRWHANWQPLPITADDVVPRYPCDALCNGLIGHGLPAELAGDETSGHTVGTNRTGTPSSSSSGDAASSSSSTSPTPPAASCGPFNVAGGQPSHYTNITVSGASCSVGRALATSDALGPSAPATPLGEGYTCTHPTDSASLEAQCVNGSAEVDLYANQNG